MAKTVNASLVNTFSVRRFCDPGGSVFRPDNLSYTLPLVPTRSVRLSLLVKQHCTYKEESYPTIHVG
jgi:hypothetical protein